jgi:CheY-like chemotaxis protein
MRASILVVEDSDEVRELLAVLLEGDGFSVVACGGADEALALARRARPDLVLTDLMLGATSGLDLITRLRSDLAPPIPPIVVCSGFTGFEREARERGADAFVPKPFDEATIRRTVETVLARRGVAKSERDDAEQRSRKLRAKMIESAKVATSRFDQFDQPPVRARATVVFLSRYFGFGEAFVVLLRGEELRITDSSDQQLWRLDGATDLVLCHDILETASALLVPDLQSLGAEVRDPGGRLLRFFAGVPLLIDSVGVGALCFVDQAPHPFGAGDYSLLEAFARRGSAVMSNRETEAPRLWTSSGVMSRDGLAMVLGAELSRMGTTPLSLSLVAFVGRPPTLPLPERTALAQLGDRRFALLVTRPGVDDAQHVLSDFLAAVARAGDFGGAGLVRIEEGGESLFDVRSILAAADHLLDSAVQAAPGTVVRTVICREPLLQMGEAPPR